MNKIRKNEQENIIKILSDASNCKTSQTSDSHPVTRVRALKKLLYKFVHWFQENTFAPAKLQGFWRHPLLGYIVAVVSQLIVALIVSILFQIFPEFRFLSILSITVVLLIALNWGAGPGLLSTLVGVLLIDFLLLPPYLAFHLMHPADVTGLLLYLGVGIIIALLTSRTECAKRRAESLQIQLSALVDAVPDILSIFDNEGKLIRLNRVGREIVNSPYGQEMFETLIMMHKACTPEGEVVSHESLPLTRALRGEAVHSMDLCYRSEEGQPYYAAVSASPFYNQRGRVEGVVTISHDITALCCSEQEAAERAGQLEAIFEAMTDGIVVYNCEGGILRINTAYRKLIALDANYHLSTSCCKSGDLLTLCDDQGNILSEEKRPIQLILHGEVLKGKNTLDVLFPTIYDATIHLNISGAPIYDAQGNVNGGVLICRDVTARRQLERRTHDALNALLAMAEALVQVSQEVETLEICRSGCADDTQKLAQPLAELTCKFLGCQRLCILALDQETEKFCMAAIVGLLPEEVNQWLDEQQWSKQFSDLPDSLIVSRLKANETLIIDKFSKPGQGETNAFGVPRALVSPLFAGNQLVGILVMDYCDTDHIYTPEEMALSSAVARLIAFVIERERFLRERAESQARELSLLQANQRMDEFLSIASHELRTPLTAIKGNIQLAGRRLNKFLQREKPLSDVLLHMFEDIHMLLDRAERQVGLQDRLVSDLLDVSRIQANKLVLRRDDCNLVEIISEVIMEQRQSMPERTILMHLDGEQEVHIYADADRIGQVLTNYLTNALKYSTSDRPVRVELEVGEQQVRVSVHDEGAGLPLEEQKHIWERFYRVPGIEVKSGSGAGLGLGLHICRTIIRAHGGEVGVESSPGLGSTFWFTLQRNQSSTQH